MDTDEKKLSLFVLLDLSIAFDTVEITTSISQLYISESLNDYSSINNLTTCISDLQPCF